MILGHSYGIGDGRLFNPIHRAFVLSLILFPHSRSQRCIFRPLRLRIRISISEWSVIRRSENPATA
jgi:hypothetical protein